MVQDDLVLMRREPAGWHLAAAALAFPSSWRLAEKFGRPMDTIHADVPGWAGPMAGRVARIFDALRRDAPVWRLNWSIQFGGGLRMALPKNAAGGAAPGRGDAPEGAPLVRVERQTLRRLACGDILFTIKVMLDPVDAFARHPDGARLAGALASQLAALTPDQLAYKGLTDERETLLARLTSMAEPAGTAATTG